MLWWILSVCIAAGAGVVVGDGVEQISVAGFNIQVFGQSKMNKEGVPETLVRIIRAFDLVFIQEIRDAEMTSPGELLTLVNVGRAPEDHPP